VIESTHGPAERFTKLPKQEAPDYTAKMLSALEESSHSATAEVTLSLMRTAAALRNLIEREALAESGLSWSAYQVLWLTSVASPVETHVIADECGVSKATLSGLLTTLEKQNLIQRCQSEADKRFVEVTITAEGLRVYTQAAKKIAVVEANVLVASSPIELKKLAATVAGLI
jgi:DNA-binding MarR family transcriptional regulator